MVRQKWEIDELIESWSLLPDDLVVVGNKSGTTRLGFAVLLKFFELEARFPSAPGEVLAEATDFVARPLHLRSGTPATPNAARSSQRSCR